MGYTEFQGGAEGALPVANDCPWYHHAGVRLCSAWRRWSRSEATGPGLKLFRPLFAVAGVTACSGARPILGDSVPEAVLMAFVVGLTGGIGSGKSAAADEFARLGATVVDTDAIAHELTGPGGAAMADIKRIFGSEFISESNALNREKMRELVFREPAQKKRLEALLHPLIREESARRIAAATGPYVLHVVPLLIESAGYRERVGRVVVAPEALRSREYGSAAPAGSGSVAS